MADLSEEERQLEHSLQMSMDGEEDQYSGDPRMAAEGDGEGAQEGEPLAGEDAAADGVMRLNLNGEQINFASGHAAPNNASAAGGAQQPFSPGSEAQRGGAHPPDDSHAFKLGEAIVHTREVISCVKCDSTNGHVYMGTYTGDLILFDFSSYREVWRRTVTADGKPVSISCLDVNGTKLVLGCQSGHTLIYDLETFRVAQCWTEHKGRVSGVAWVNEHVYSVAHDGYFLVRDAASKGKILHSFITCTCPLSALQVESPGIAYVGSWDGQVKRLDLERKIVTLVLRASALKESPIRALALAPAPPSKVKKRKGGGEEPPAFVLVVAHGIGELKSWDLRTGKVHVEAYQGCTDVINALTVWNGRLYAGGDDRTVRMFDLHSGAALESLSGHDNGVTSLAICGVTPVITAEEAEEALAAAAAASYRSGRAKSASAPAQQGTGNELLVSTSFDLTARAFKLAAVEAGVALRLLKVEEARQMAFDAFVASKTKSKKTSGKKKSKKKGASGNKSAGASTSASKKGSKVGTARSSGAGDAPASSSRKKKSNKK